VLMVSVNLGDIHKGLSHGLSVVRRLASDHSRLQTILLGRANAAIASATDGIRCTTHEAMTPGELALYYRAADVTLIPSLADNFPYVAIESLACGTPFVAFSEGGPKEIADLERNGLLAPCFDEGQLAECVRRVLTDSRLRDSLGTSGLAWVRQHCSPDVMVKDVQQAYSDAINIFYGHSQTHTSRIKPSGQ
jgi:glycosyltransferase involved in cell wall biosynthesis